jgi:hypothetical protein
MTNQQHPITPPPELVQQWVAEIWHEGTPVRVALSDEHIAARATQWGADQELEACCEWLIGWDTCEGERLASLLREGRRPKPPSLKEQALAVLEEEPEDSKELIVFDTDQVNIIRRALEQLPE